ncbi:hypothetical protein CISG_04042 [Coccidioides immitis RMSCC 3703]|uniref:Uncharacterized protein n=1 Tax=Coccidioides immitis RMSCC 3703 TaxID=454286 RepID=A0A0J8QS99_COCIT|nr:hypothetical protein CISG_04042 [Coccidioides immitis RMSCC 3703]
MDPAYPGRCLGDGLDSMWAASPERKTLILIPTASGDTAVGFFRRKTFALLIRDQFDQIRSAASHRPWRFRQPRRLIGPAPTTVSLCCLRNSFRADGARVHVT